MYFTYVVRPGEAPEGRSPQWTPFFEFLCNYYMRIAFVLQLLGYLGLLACAFSSGTKSMSLLWLLKANSQNVGQAPIIGVLFSCGAFLISNVLILGFVAIEDDDSSIKQSRGFRAGTKMLHQAASTGALCWTLNMVSFYANNYFFDDAWFKDQVGGGSDWLIYFSARSMDAISLLLYAPALFLLEVYHSEGVGEAWGWISNLSFRFTSLAEIVALILYGHDSFHVIDTVYTILFGVSLIVACFWAFMFEPISHFYDVKLSQSVIRNEYYKSRNAMAYYGPAVVNAEGEIDINQAAQQAQACLKSGCC